MGGGGLRGASRLVRGLQEMFRSGEVAEDAEKIVKEGAEELRDAMRALAPRDTGELERAILARRKYGSGENIVFEVGVPGDSMAIDQALATEFGTWNFRVGSPHAPKTSWEGKSKPTATMPWARTAFLWNAARIQREMRRKVAKALAEAHR